MITLEQAEKDFEKFDKNLNDHFRFEEDLQNFIDNELGKCLTFQEKYKIAIILSLAKWKVNRLFKIYNPTYNNRLAKYSLGSSCNSCAICFLYRWKNSKANCYGCPLSRCDNTNILTPWRIAVEQNNKHPLIRTLNNLLKEA